MEIGPSFEPFLILIVLSPARAWVNEALSNRHSSGTAITTAMGTMFVVVAGQFPKLSKQTNQVRRVVPILQLSSC